MKIDVKVKNFGRIKEADLQVRPFTVIAGKNSSGKSFITKALYSFLKSINKDFVSLEVAALISGINAELNYYLTSIRLSAQESDIAHAILIHTQGLISIATQIYGENTFTSQIDSSPQLIEKLNTVKELLALYIASVERKKKYEKIKNGISKTQARIKQLENIFLRPGDIYSFSIQNEFKNSLKDNFQTPNLSQLINFSVPSGKSEFEFSEIGSIQIEGESVNFKLWPSGIDKIQQLSNIVYLESPVYWRLKQPLERVFDLANMKFLSTFRKREILSGVPQHFYDLVDLLKEQVKRPSGDCHFSNIGEEITNQIGGQITINPTGTINYRDKNTGSEINLYTTATGIINLGIIGLLIERNIITKGSFIIIDEPEVNLHPGWQKVLVDALYNLSLNGINIIIATHSIDMMRCIESIIDDLDEDEAMDHFGINQLSSEGTSIDMPNIPTLRVASISEDLGETFFNMHVGM